MIKVIGAIIFTVAVLVLVNIIGDLAIQPQSEPREVTVIIQPQPQTEPQAETVAKAAPAQIPAPKAAETVASATVPGDVDKGKNIFRKKCMSCHTIDKGGKNRTGPNLWGIVGKTKASAERYRYSKSLKRLGGVWSEAEIKSFIAGPRTFAPDTKMTFAGLKSQQDRDNVLAYLKTRTD
ncbi:MAG: cytochrome c family protein [Magnetovibrio sp.]|nr:cytochrome c family protein [Magnetovibrio sp.]